MKEAEARRLSDVKEEEKRNKECLLKVEKTKNEEIDDLLAVQYDLEEDNSKAKNQVNQLQKAVDAAEAEKLELDERIAIEVSRRLFVDRKNL